MALEMLIEQKAMQIKKSLVHLPTEWEGKSAILEMRRRDYQWRQLEWIGFYGEMLARDLLAACLEIPGKRYDNVVFDAFSLINWDIKVHPNNQSVAILNDREAVDSSIGEHGYHGLVMICVDCEYDTDGAFKAWHDRIKGRMSVYENERINRGAPSRMRKTKAVLDNISTILLNRENTQMLGSAQKGWRNADGSPRREKYSISHSQIFDLKFAIS